MKNPCLTCENRGCGTYHDQCKEHIEYSNFHKAEKEALRNRYDFARKERKVLKGHKGWENQKNIGF